MTKIDFKKVFKTLEYLDENSWNGKKFIIDFMMSKPIKLNFNDECFKVVSRKETVIKYTYNSEVNNNEIN